MKVQTKRQRRVKRSRPMLTDNQIIAHARQISRAERNLKAKLLLMGALTMAATISVAIANTL